LWNVTPCSLVGFTRLHDVMTKKSVLTYFRKLNLCATSVVFNLGHAYFPVVSDGISGVVQNILRGSKFKIKYYFAISTE
jgi:hypothetical protein